MRQAKCEHPACTCRAQEDGFCSDSCAFSLECTGCRCGHRDCGADALRRPAGTPPAPWPVSQERNLGVRRASYRRAG
jgi:hypothetical protein